GAVGALEETANTATSIADALPGGNTREQVEQDAANGGVQLPFGMGSIGGSRAARYLARPLDAVTDTLGAVHDFLPSSHTVTGGVVESVGLFITGNILAGRYLKFLGLSKVGGPVGQQVARDVIAGATAFDPYEDRLTNLLRDHAGLRDPVTAFPVADPSDNEAVARFKAAIENGGLGAMGEGLFHAVRALRAARHGDTAGAAAAAEEAERVIGEPEMQRLVSEELRIKATQERWLKQTHRETESVTDRTTESTTTTTTEGGPAGTEAPRPKIEGLPNTPGGEAIPQRVSLSPEDAARLASSIERAGGNPSQLDQEAVGVIWRNLDRMQSSEDGVTLVRELEQLYEKNYLAARGAQADTEALALQANRWAQTAADIASTSTRERDMIVQAMVSDLQDARRVGSRALA
ncbi:MAG TPA: hypothetical protein VFU47_00930, partial [Armatimonadota bacterium]|nr:hypothetical protein [Armatimonadota bacterium]